MLVGVAHPGTQHSWQTALAFQEGGNLGWYKTSFYYKAHAWPDRLVNLLPPRVSAKVERELRRRYHPLLDPTLVRRDLSSELLERPLRLVGARGAADRLMRRRHVNFPDKVWRTYKDAPVDIIWGPHDCLEAAIQIQRRGGTFILDQPIGHFNSLRQTLLQEREKHPDYFHPGDVYASAESVDRQNLAAKHADIIVVGSEFAARTMIENGTDPDKLVTLPYGYDETLAPDQFPTRVPQNGTPTKFLFVGSVGPRKGIAYLLEAFRKIDPKLAQLDIVGPLDMPENVLARDLGPSNYLGQATRDEVFKLMQQAHCFVFPSLFEGGGIVLYEAAACGLGVIQSDRCGDGVRGQGNGIILEQISVDDIVRSVEMACTGNTMQQWRNASWAHRAERTWAEYRSGARNVAASIDTRRQ